MVNLPLQWSVQILGHDVPVWIAAGQLVEVSVRLKFVCSSNRVYGVRVPGLAACTWLDAQGQTSSAPSRRTLIPTIAFNQEISFRATIAAPRAPGAYHLRWEFTLHDVAEIGLPPTANAAMGVATLVSQLPRSVNDWRIESSVNAAEIARILDGDLQTAWDSRTAQDRGQWVRLNLSRPRLIDGIQFLAPGNGFPRAYTLTISADDNAWMELARVVSDNVDDVSVALAPQMIQYAQVELLAPAQTSWKISEIRVHPGIAWRVTASHNTESVYCAIDNRADTEWAVESPQEPGMWFQLDLGREECVTGLRLTPATNENPYAFRISVWDAAALRWRIAHEQNANHAAVDARFDAVATQFINIQLVEPSENRWTICNAHVYREMTDWLGPET